VLKSFLILVVAAGLYRGWRGASAATRHLIWFLAIASLVALPLLSSLLPSWKQPLWLVSTGITPGNQFSVALELVPTTETTALAVEAKTARRDQSPVAKNSIGMGFNISWLGIAFVAWVAGVLLAFSSMAVSYWRVHRLARRAQPFQDSEWSMLLRETCKELRLRRRVTLLRSVEEVIPMTWGWCRPVVLLPGAAEQWPTERRRVVLMHELAHVRRWDCLTHTITRIVCALYWFNPLVWMAARRMCVERERACDDLVLKAGCKASDYAAELVEIARSFRRVPQAAAIGMARSSGLHRRIGVILDERANRNALSRRAALALALTAVAGLLITACATSTKRSSTTGWSLEQSKVSDQLKRFVAEKEQQAYAGAKAESKKIVPEYKAIFAAAKKGEWLAISNKFEKLRLRAPQYEYGGQDVQLHGTAWQAVLEIWGSFGNIAAGGERYMVELTEDAIESIPPGSIYFGGTDPGRFMITALQKSHVNADPFFTITQNALADGTYLDYVRRMYGDKIYVPTKQDNERAFNDYTRDAEQRLKENKLKPEESVKIVDGRVQVSGQVSVMAINARLAKTIFDKNPKREFYLEESFPLEWMYPHLTPNGPIMKINREPLAQIPDDVARKDREYWTRFFEPMIGNWLHEDTSVQEVVAFARRAYPKPLMAEGFGSYVDAPNKWSSKLRSSIAGVYAWRLRKGVDNPAEQKRMLKEADFAFRQAFAVCPWSPEAVFRYINLLVSVDRLDDAILIADVPHKLEPDNKQIQNLVTELSRMKSAKKN
jgi:beta-lactamase regulating signal transducer with metallopeptidase domain